jgi:hypothetical protein
MKKYLVAFLGAAILVPALACGGGDDDDAQASGSQPTQAPATQASGTQPTQRPQGTATSAASGSGNELSNFGRNVRQLKSYKASFVMESGGTRQEGTMEIIVPDKLRMTIAGVEYVVIGSDTYVKAGPTWIKAPGGGGGLGFSPTLFTGLAASLATAAETGQGVTKGGTDTVNGTRCQLYTASAQGTNTEVCIANDLPLRIVSTQAGFKYTIILSDFDRVPDIRAPI